MKPKTILLVEDNADDALLMERAFRMAGFDNLLHVVNDGQKAIDYLSGEARDRERSRGPG